MRLSSLQPKQCIFESVGGKDAYFETWKRDIHPVLCEVALSPEQIDQLFKSVEKGAGRSALGKGMDAVKGAADKISDAWFNKFGGMLQSSDVVQGFDAKWEQIKSSVAEKNPKLANSLSKYKEFADNNPKTQKFLLAIAASVATALGIALAGGIGASALAVGTGAGIATGIVNIADRLLKNEKLSTAVGRGVTAGLTAGVTAVIGQQAAKILSGMVQGAVKAVVGDGRVLKYQFINTFGESISAVGKPDDVKKFGSLINQIKDAATPDAAQAAAEKLVQLQQYMTSPEYLAMLDKIREVKPLLAATKEVTKIVGTLATSIGSAVAGNAASGAGQKKESRQFKGTKLNEQQLNELFGITGNKVDASSLMKAWKKAGSPTDSDAVAKLLADAGVDTNLVTTAFKDMGVEVTAPTGDTKIEPTMDAPTPTPTDKKEPTVADPTTTTDTTTTDATTDGSADTKVQGNLDLSGLSKLLPSIGKNPTPFKAAISALKANKPLSPVMKAALGNAFMDMVSLDPASTGQVSNMLKKVSAQ